MTNVARRQKMREYRLRTIDERRAYDRKRYAENKEKRLAYVRSWRTKNPQKLKATLRSWVSRNYSKKLAHCTARHTRLKTALPKWLTPAQKQEIRKIYTNCPKDYVVDHIVPIKGKTVCGLHVPWNLQYLTKAANLKKGNKF